MAGSSTGSSMNCASPVRDKTEIGITHIDRIVLVPLVAVALPMMSPPSSKM